MARVSGYKTPEAKEEFCSGYRKFLDDSLAADDLQKHLWLGNKDSSVCSDFTSSVEEPPRAIHTTGAINLNNKEENKMSQRKTVIVELFDDSVGIDAESSLVFSTDLVTDLNREQVIHQVLMEENVAEMLALHNDYRSEQINEDILNRTGNEVNLKPVKLKELRWVVR